MFGKFRRDSRCLLVIGHPGHELRVYGWVAKAQPRVCILTDGSGGDGVPRIEHTLAILQELGARPASICGELSDRRIYEFILKQQTNTFETLGRRLARLIVDQQIDTVVSDGIEGYNPTHDLCELLTRAAVAIARPLQDRPCRHYTVPLMGDPRKPTRAQTREVREVDLGEALFQQKLNATLSYAELGGPTLKQEVEMTIRNFGERAFAREYLFGAAPKDRWELPFEREKPFYETYGEQQVAAGRYQFVIRFREHFLPIAKRLSMLASEAPAPRGEHAACAS